MWFADVKSLHQNVNCLFDNNVTVYVLYLQVKNAGNVKNRTKLAIICTIVIMVKLLTADVSESYEQAPA